MGKVHYISSDSDEFHFRICRCFHRRPPSSLNHRRDQQRKTLWELQKAVRTTAEFTRAQATERLIRLPTGDGMALVFFSDPEAPVRCAVELTSALRQSGVPLRMGIHTGPVYRVADINANQNVAGGGINIAQRAMDCGDAGHILVSEEVAKILTQLTQWETSIRDLGEVEVKHGVRLRICNLSTADVGNAELPQKLRSTSTPTAPDNGTDRTKPSRFTIPVALAILTLVLGLAGSAGSNSERKSRQGQEVAALGHHRTMAGLTH